jgi:hypothetical protein
VYTVARKIVVSRPSPQPRLYSDDEDIRELQKEFSETASASGAGAEGRGKQGLGEHGAGVPDSAQGSGSSTAGGDRPARAEYSDPQDLDTEDDLTTPG